MPRNTIGACLLLLHCCYLTITAAIHNGTRRAGLSSTCKPPYAERNLDDEASTPAQVDNFTMLTPGTGALQ
jgi:hypothetical protein